jgi:hypothetical protein|tara:strand:- start:24066 stop:24302 length:237 start_codon:yes stop_codon:yes gene_type:complete
MIPRFPEPSITNRGGSEGLSFFVRGVASDPYELEIISEGFEIKTVTLNWEGKKEIRVPMVPLVKAIPPKVGDPEDAGE